MADVRNLMVQTLLQFWHIYRVISACKVFHQQWETAIRSQAVLVEEHLHNSHPMWICLSLWEKKGGSKLNREGRQERNVLRSHHVISVFPCFYIAAQWLHVGSSGLLAKFSKPTQLTLLFFCPVVWRVRGVPALRFRGKERNSERRTYTWPVKGRMNWRCKQGALLVFWPEGICFVLTGEPDEEDDEKDKERAERKWPRWGEGEEQKLASSVACRQRWMRGYS